LNYLFVCTARILHSYQYSFITITIIRRTYRHIFLYVSLCKHVIFTFSLQIYSILHHSYSYYSIIVIILRRCVSMNLFTALTYTSFVESMPFCKPSYSTASRECHHLLLIWLSVCPDSLFDSVYLLRNVSNWITY
jgi:hypothetical protein